MKYGFEVCGKWYTRNDELHQDREIPTVTEEIKQAVVRQESRYVYASTFEFSGYQKTKIN